MFSFLRRFNEQEDGAVTVDWVVLTAAVVSFGAVTVIVILDGSDNVTGQTTEYLNNQDYSTFSNIQDVHSGG